MAITSGISGSQQTATASEVAMFVPPASNVPSAVMVRCTGGAAITVRSQRLHGATGGLRIPVGEKEYLRIMDGQMDTIYVVGDTGVVDWAPVSITAQWHGVT